MQLESRRVELLFLRAVSPVETPLLLGHGDEDEDADEGEEEHPAEDRAHDVDQVGGDGGVVEGGRGRGKGVLKWRGWTVLQFEFYIFFIDVFRNLFCVCV